LDPVYSVSPKDNRPNRDETANFERKSSLLPSSFPTELEKSSQEKEQTFRRIEANIN
jgi:hypothetical protein